MNIYLKEYRVLITLWSFGISVAVYDDCYLNRGSRFGSEAMTGQLLRVLATACYLRLAAAAAATARCRH